jgi:hypothetical protein
MPSTRRLTGGIVPGVTDMRSLRLVGFVLALTLPLCAQQDKLSERELGDYKGSDDAVRSVMDYCDMLDAALRQQQPRIFAETKIESTGEAKIITWGEFASKDEWQAAGNPAPLAFVWNKDDVIVRVTTVARAQRGKPSIAQQRLDYCYNDDAQLVRIRAVWYAPTDCEFLFPCRLISGHDFLLSGQRPAVTDWVFKEDGTIQRLRNGTAVEDYFDPSYSLTVSDLHLQTSFDLPFARMPKK